MAQMVKNPSAMREDPGLIPELGASSREGNGYSLQYSWLENPMDRGAWQGKLQEVAKSQTLLTN